ncbi:MAG TPA: hypothetical protein PL193_14640 [Xanthobacteraceae bacterium]|nr:hypothetical protein [Xanthobacteraceae bacterium]
MYLRCFMALGCAFLLSACVTTETVRFTPQPNQQLVLRDGHQNLVSRSQSTIVSIRPASRQIQANERPVYVLNIQNVSNRPVNFLVSNVSVEQIVGSERMALPVVAHSDLEVEEKNRQVGRVMLAAVAVGLNSAAVSNRGYFAQAHAQEQNQALIRDVQAAGQQNLAALEALVIKDHTVMPGEQYGGQIHISPPQQQTGGKNYLITVFVGDERHEFRVTQAGG